MDAPEHLGALDAPAIAYVRPHDLELARDCAAGPALAATVREVRPLGPIVLVQMQEDATGAALEAEVSRRELEALGLAEGQRVFARPRRWQVFATPDVR
ncbi:MAG: TOBE-like domain-containing protein [Deltaproteobacteria bacterium]|nr:TOBE-like domain-containing protein [Deltaproteobacteria bacterium]